MKITHDMIVEMKPCNSGLKEFDRNYPDGLELTKENLQKVISEWSGDMGSSLSVDFFVLNYFGNKIYGEFDKNFKWYNHPDQIIPMTDYLWEQFKKKLGSKLKDSKTKAAKVKPLILTTDMLRKVDACEDGINAFSEYFPDGMPVTKENILKMFKINKSSYQIDLMYGYKALLGDKGYSHFAEDWCWDKESNYNAMLDYVWKMLKEVYGNRIKDSKTKSSKAVEPLVLTKEMLSEAGACGSGVAAFSKAYPNGVKITKKNIIEAIKSYTNYVEHGKGACLSLNWGVATLLTKKEGDHFNDTWLWHQKENHPAMIEYFWTRLKKKYGNRVTEK